MNRETQRMARNMQLAHEARTRKKVAKSVLFDRFNFRPDGAGVGAGVGVVASAKDAKQPKVRRPAPADQHRQQDRETRPRR